MIVLVILSAALGLMIWRKSCELEAISHELERYKTASEISNEACNATIEAVIHEQKRVEEKREILEQTIENSGDWASIRLPVEVSRMCESLCGYSAKGGDP